VNVNARQLGGVDNQDAVASESVGAGGGATGTKMARCPSVAAAVNSGEWGSPGQGSQFGCGWPNFERCGRCVCGFRGVQEDGVVGRRKGRGEATAVE